MHDQPEPTEREEELAPERLPEEEAKSGPGHEAPREQLEDQDSSSDAA